MSGAPKLRVLRGGRTERVDEVFARRIGWQVVGDALPGDYEERLADRIFGSDTVSARSVERDPASAREVGRPSRRGQRGARWAAVALSLSLAAAFVLSVAGSFALSMAGLSEEPVHETAPPISPAPELLPISSPTEGDPQEVVEDEARERPRDAVSHPEARPDPGANRVFPRRARAKRPAAAEHRPGAGASGEAPIVVGAAQPSREASISPDREPELPVMHLPARLPLPSEKSFASLPTTAAPSARWEHLGAAGADSPMAVVDVLGAGRSLLGRL